MGALPIRIVKVTLSGLTTPTQLTRTGTHVGTSQTIGVVMKTAPFSRKTADGTIIAAIIHGTSSVDLSSTRLQERLQSQRLQSQRLQSQSERLQSQRKRLQSQSERLQSQRRQQAAPFDEY